MEDPFSIAGVREYRYGDPLSALNWKATARSGKLQVHNRSFTADHTLLIWFNCDPDPLWSMAHNHNRLECGIRYAATLAQYAISRGIDTGFGSNGQRADCPESEEAIRISSGGGNDHLETIFETLALLVFMNGITFEEFLEQELNLGTSERDIVLFSCSINPRVELLLERLKSRGNVIHKVFLEIEAGEEQTSLEIDSAAGDQTPGRAAR
jgi:uncharacterized protein (DUF58 family)